MLTYVSMLGAALFGVLALIHFGWAATGRVPAAVVPTKGDGTRLFEPKRSESAVVGSALLVAAFLLLQRGGVGPTVLPHWARATGSAVIAIMMLLRAIGDRQYVGLFKRVRKSVFGRLDTAYYTPLVILLGTFAGLVAFLGR